MDMDMGIGNDTLVQDHFLAQHFYKQSSNYHNYMKELIFL